MKRRLVSSWSLAFAVIAAALVTVSVSTGVLEPGWVQIWWAWYAAMLVFFAWLRRSP
jgi:hypothetical protein